MSINEEELMNKAVLEERRFSDTEVVNETRKQAAINIDLMYKFLTQSLKDQLRYLAVSIKRYVNKNRSRPEKLEIAEKYLLTELARLFNESKKTEGNLSVVLGLPRYGNKVTKAGNKLNRLVKLANKEQDTRGYMSKNSQLRINEQFTELVNAFKERMFDTEELNLDDSATTQMTVSQSFTTKDDTYEFHDINNQDKLDIMKEFKDIVGLDKCKFISKGSNLSVLVDGNTSDNDEALREIENDYKLSNSTIKFSDSSELIDKSQLQIVNPLELNDDDLMVVTDNDIYPVTLSPSDKFIDYISNSGNKIESTDNYDWFDLGNNLLVGLSNDKKSILLNNKQINNYNKLINFKYI